MTTEKADIPEKEKVMPEKTGPGGIKVILGGQEWLIKPLVIKESREWRRKAAPFQAAIARYASINSDNVEEFEKALVELLTTRLDETADLFFEYAKDLNRGEIEAIATDAEIVQALNEVNRIAFPFGETGAKLSDRK